MTKCYLADLRDRDAVSGVFLVKEKSSAVAKNGKPFLTIRLMDKSGEVDAKVWENVEELGRRFERDDFIAIEGRASLYLNRLQVAITSLSRVPEEQVELADFLPAAPRPTAEMLAELQQVLAGVTNPYLHRLLAAFFGDAEILDRYAVAPAAKGMHHVYLGGLLEHSLSVVRLVDAVMPLYPWLDRDLLVAGALLHDIGKVREMSYERAFDYTDEGKLIGHITIGVEMLQERLAAIPDFPAETALLLKHLLLSHHGQYEYGSPKRPKTLEATVLNHLDDLDAKLNGIRTHIRREPANEGRWTGYHRLFDRYFYKPAAVAEPANLPPVAVASPQPAAAAPVAAAPPAMGKKQAPGGQGFHNTPFSQLQEQARGLFDEEE